MATRGRKPKERSGRIIDMRYPRDIETVIQQVKNHRAGTEVYLNAGVIKPETDVKGKTIGAVYQPFIIELASKEGAKIAVKGQKARRGGAEPSGWNDIELGAWQPGWCLQDARQQHCSDVRNLIVDSESNLININGTEYCLGIDSVVPAHRGNKHYNWIAGMKIAHSNTAGIDTLVGRISDRAGEINGMVFGFPNQLIFWGQLYRNGLPMSIESIRQAAKNPNTDWSNSEFKEFDTDVASTLFKGEPVTKESFSNVIESVMKDADAWEPFQSRKNRTNQKKSILDKAWENLNFQSRQDPGGCYCFGLMNVQVGIALVPEFDESGQNRQFRFYIGQYCVDGLKETAWTARKRISSTVESVDEPIVIEEEAAVKI